MTKEQVVIGGVYLAKVSGKLTPVRLTEVSAYGGWNAINTMTRRAVRIRTAAKLRGKVRCNGCSNCKAWQAERTRVEALVRGLAVGSPERMAIVTPWLEFAKAHVCNA